MTNMAHNRRTQMNYQTEVTFEPNPRCHISAHQKASDKDVPALKRGPQIHAGFISPRLLHGSIQIMKSR